MNLYRDVVKVFFDWSLALVLLLLMFPVFILIMIWLSLVQKENIFFIQPRPAYRGKIIRVYKFRSMTEARDSTGQSLPDNVRVKAWGKWLRKSNLDELPQLLNILKGEMSFVGPRPLLQEYLQLYTAREQKRMQVRPGITGWAQINGRNAITWKQKFEMDTWYVEHQSFILDLKIFCITLLKLATLKGFDGDVLPEKYNGNN